MPDAGKLAACSRPIGSQIGDVTKWTNRRPEADPADQSGALKFVTERGKEPERERAFVKYCHHRATQ